MQSDFYRGEKFYRAVLPIETFIKEDGTITSGAFKDPQGLSVDRQFNRDDKDAIEYIKNHKKGYICSFTKEDCDKQDIHYEYCPVEGNVFHSEIHNSPTKKLLSRSKCKYLASICKIESK